LSSPVALRDHSSWGGSTLLIGQARNLWKRPIQIGSLDITTNGGGDSNFDTKGNLQIETGGGLVDIDDFITATTTELCTPDLQEDTCPYGVGGTSEFSAAIPVTQ
jgi:hypothetical protein